MKQAILLLLTVCAGAAQDVRFQADVNLARISCVARDRDSGRPVLDLKPDEFTISTPDGKIITPAYVWREADEPLTIGMVMDMSGSQLGYVRANRTEAERFLARLFRPGDQAFITAFGLGLRLIAPLTSDTAVLHAGFDRLSGKWRRGSPPWPAGVRTRLGSPIHDSLYYSARELLKPQKGRKALLLISDGADTFSKHSLSETIEMLQSAETPLYAIQRGRGLGSKLRRISEETGGVILKPKKDDFTDAFAAIETELRSTLVLGYHASEQAGWPGRRVSTTRPNTSLRCSQ